MEDVFGLFYPRICCGCDSHLLKHEKNLCLSCLHHLPKTYFWDYEINPVEEKFHGRLPVESACAFLHFETGSVTQSLMHRFKYEGKSEIGTELGKAFGRILAEKEWFTQVDFIVPVPLHPSKEMRRGYNQSTFIADGLAETLQIPVRSNILKRTKATDSQTRKGRFQRSENVENVFKVNDGSAVKGKNILIVDDVVTTGATLEAVGISLIEAGAARIHIATLATT